jgi:hypothetical protein
LLIPGKMVSAAGEGKLSAFKEPSQVTALYNQQLNRKPPFCLSAANQQRDSAFNCNPAPPAAAAHQWYSFYLPADYGFSQAS